LSGILTVAALMRTGHRLIHYCELKSFRSKLRRVTPTDLQDNRRTILIEQHEECFSKAFRDPEVGTVSEISAPPQTRNAAS
jgi:hypothetical protein